MSIRKGKKARNPILGRLTLFLRSHIFWEKMKGWRIMGRVNGIDDNELDDPSLQIHEVLRNYIQMKMNETENELVPYLANTLDGGNGESRSEELRRVELEAMSFAYFDIKNTLWSIEFNRQNSK